MMKIIYSPKRALGIVEALFAAKYLDKGDSNTCKEDPSMFMDRTKKLIQEN